MIPGIKDLSKEDLAPDRLQISGNSVVAPLLSQPSPYTKDEDSSEPSEAQRRQPESSAESSGVATPTWTQASKKQAQTRRENAPLDSQRSHRNSARSGGQEEPGATCLPSQRSEKQATNRQSVGNGRVENRGAPKRVDRVEDQEQSSNNSHRCMPA